jgi:hypothetical protein
LQGCGIVRFSTAAAAATAKSVLHGKHKWTEDAPPMVVEWVNEDKMRSTCCKAGGFLDECSACVCILPESGGCAVLMVVEWVNEDKMRSTCCKAGE